MKTFLRRSAGYTAASFVTAVLNYALHPTLGRLMSVEDFGEVQALISLSALFGILLAAGSLTAVRTASHAENMAVCVREARFLERFVLTLAAVSIGGVLVLATPLREALHFKTLLPLLALAPYLYFVAVFALRNGVLLGCGNLKAVALGNGLSALARLVCATAGVLLGFGVLGAVLGIVVGQALVCAWVVYKTRPWWRATPGVQTLDRPNARRQMRLFGAAALSSGFVAVLSTGDVIAAKRLFSPELAGQYSAISVAARSLFYAFGPVVAVMLPLVKQHAERRDNTWRLRQALLVGAAITIGPLFLFWAAPGSIIRILLGVRYAALAPLLPWLGLSMLLGGIVNLVLQYTLMVRPRQVIWLAAVGSLVLIAGLGWGVSRPADLIRSFGLAAAATLLTFLWLGGGRVTQSQASGTTQ